ncbi:MAG: DUF305 domain-containing protein [bacterium]|nr:DUF305 domain-containing protein [Gemmatimonadota bacterium]HIL91095.1 DUF305 domain-containing protein [Gemmatimonadota bacterium]
MKRLYSPILLLAAFSVSLGSCGGAARSAADLEALAARNRQGHSPADVHFMTNMVPHHAQAVLFAGWAESHQASSAIQIFCARMVVAQRDEIVTMRSWLLERDEPSPPAEYIRMRMPAGADHQAMPGMLTEAQLNELDYARGLDFDRLFLKYMIPHHEGALSMVDGLFGSYGGAQNDFIFKLASDMYADQTTEIEHMQLMLATYPSGRQDP